MRRMSMMAVLGTAAMMLGCGGARSEASSQAVALTPATPMAELSVGDEASASMDAPDVAPIADASALPASPWSDAPLGSEVVPSPILSAWEHAENRAQCAPLAPRALGAGEGARARVGELEGGWSVEFDRRGMPGVGRNGEPCARCGRGVFGIAGTNLTPQDLVTEESEAEVPAPSFADGSSLSIEPPLEGEQVAAATLTVRGQGCVYQVWSFLGEQHVRELVSSLRLVEVPGPAHVASR